MWGMSVLARTREMTGESKTRSGSPLKVPDGARILIVCDDDSETERLKTILQKAGIVSECTRSITAGVGGPQDGGRCRGAFPTLRCEGGSCGGPATSAP